MLLQDLKQLEFLYFVARKMSYMLRLPSGLPKDKTFKCGAQGLLRKGARPICSKKGRRSMCTKVGICTNADICRTPKKLCDSHFPAKHILMWIGHIILLSFYIANTIICYSENAFPFRQVWRVLNFCYSLIAFRFSQAYSVCDMMSHDMSADC